MINIINASLLRAQAVLNRRRSTNREGETKSNKPDEPEPKWQMTYRRLQILAFLYGPFYATLVVVPGIILMTYMIAMMGIIPAMFFLEFYGKWQGLVLWILVPIVSFASMKVGLWIEEKLNEAAWEHNRDLKHDYDLVAQEAFRELFAWGGMAFIVIGVVAYSVAVR